MPDQQENLTTVNVNPTDDVSKPQQTGIIIKTPTKELPDLLLIITNFLT